MADKSLDSSAVTEFGLSTGDRVAVVSGFALLAGAVGAAVPFVAGWALQLRWTPLQGPLELIDSLDRWVAVTVLAGVGLVAGGIFGGIALLEQVQITLSDSGIALDDRERTLSIARRDVGAIFLDGKKLVVLGTDSAQLIRSEVEASASEIEEGVRRHGYPWFDADPHADLFRRWLPATPDLPPAAHALLTVRAAALAKSDQDAERYREEIQRLGFVVRDGKKAQYWRPLVRSCP